ncbi:MAG: hypothetical protein U5Q03_14080 [Bacteroidota bacterium]|nr:hypothetical protein [Bacteroidota bacterium]
MTTIMFIDDTIEYCYGSGISLYNAGGVDGEDTFEIRDNEISRTEGKRGELEGFRHKNIQQQSQDT